MIATLTVGTPAWGLQRIGVDLDGVLADFASAFERWAEDVTGASAPERDCWDWWRLYPEGERLWSTFWDPERKHAHYALLGAPAIPGALDGLRMLRTRFADVTIVTARPTWVAAATEQWLNAHGVTIPVVYEEEKWTVPLDVLVDDSPDQIRETLAVGRLGLLVDQPWNRSSGLSAASFQSAVDLLSR